MESDYATAQTIVQYLTDKVRCEAKVGIVCGSGLGRIPEEMEEREVFPFSSVPHFPVSSVKGHSGALIFGKWKGVDIICMQGRVHPYEGHTLKLCALPIRVMKLLGVKVLIVTNAAGGVNPLYKAGDIMLIKDHIGLPVLCGTGPLVGPNDERFGTRFPGLSRAYPKKYRTLVKNIAKQMNIDVHEGVYMMTFGPQYETPAEVRMIHSLGADAVGMSTVHEVITATHGGMKVIGLSIIANATCKECDDEFEEITHDEVIRIMEKAAVNLIKLLEAVIARLPTEGF